MAVRRLLDHDSDLGAEATEQALPVFQCCSPVHPQPSFQIHMPCKQGSLSLHFCDKTSPILGQESREVRAARDFKVEKVSFFIILFFYIWTVYSRTTLCIMHILYFLCGIIVV